MFVRCVICLDEDVDESAFEAMNQTFISLFLPKLGPQIRCMRIFNERKAARQILLNVSLVCFFILKIQLKKSQASPGVPA